MTRPFRSQTIRLDDVDKEKDGSLNRVEAFEDLEEPQRERFGQLGCLFGSGIRDDRFGKPWADVVFPAAA